MVLLRYLRIKILRFRALAYLFTSLAGPKLYLVCCRIQRLCSAASSATRKYIVERSQREYYRCVPVLVTIANCLVFVAASNGDTSSDCRDNESRQKINSDADSGRSNLLSSITSFNKSHLRKAQSVDADR